MACRVCSVVIDIGVDSRLWSSRSVVRFVLSGVKFVGLVKYWLNELVISLLVEEVVLLKTMERFGSLMVGSSLFRDLSVFQYVFWLFLWSQGASMCCFQSCCLCSESDWFISWLRVWRYGWVGVVLRRWFLSVILVRICCGMGCVFLLIFPLGMNFLSAVMIILVIVLIS